MHSSPSSDSERLMFKATKPHFFKIIFHDTLRYKKLCIPRRFVKNYGNKLPNSLVLKVPSGEVWPVKLIKRNGEIWLENGLQEFLEYYSLAYGSFLVFEYDQRNCCFNVIILDTSASEIDYPYRDNGENENDEANNLEEELVEPNVEEAENDSILDKFSQTWKTKEKSSLPFAQPYKRMKLEDLKGRFEEIHCPFNIIGDVEEPNVEEEFQELQTKEIESDVSIKILDNLSPPRKREEKLPLPFSRPHKKMKQENCTGQSEAKRGKGNRFVKRTHSLTSEEKSCALHRAITNYKSENPFFIIAMQPTYVVLTSKLAIPASFAKKYFKKKSGGIIIKSIDGKTWSVRYSINVSNRKNAAKIYHGWRQFVDENYLAVGDVCVFELINQTEITLKVVIFRDFEDASSSPPLGNNKDLKREERSCSKAIQDTDPFYKFTSLNPFFKVKIQPSYLEHSFVNIPDRLMEKCVKQSIGKVMLQVEHRVWPVKLISCRNSRKKLSAGFRAFAKENSLQVGDGCIFELINTETGLLKVSIFRNVD